MTPRPEFFDHRIKMFEKLKVEYDEFVKSTSPCLFALDLTLTSLHMT